MFPQLLSNVLGQCGKTKSYCQIKQNVVLAFKVNTTVTIAPIQIVNEEMDRLVMNGVNKSVEYSKRVAHVICIKNK